MHSLFLKIFFWFWFIPVDLSALIREAVADANYEAAQRNRRVEILHDSDCILPAARNCCAAPLKMSYVTRCTTRRKAPSWKSLWKAVRMCAFASRELPGGQRPQGGRSPGLEREREKP
jgi:hypothetical protein